MPVRIDISDSVIAKDEPQHHLHLWGPHITTWDDNCVECGGAPNPTAETAKAGLRCECGEGIFCSAACKRRKGATLNCGVFADTPLKARPTRKHRRALVVLPGNSMARFELVWAKVKDCKLAIDHPAFDDYFQDVGTEECWLDLAVINPTLAGYQLPIVEKLGHGIAMGFASNMMDSSGKSNVDIRWANTATYNDRSNGHTALWPGPVVFFSYGYDLSDYVKVDPTNTADTQRGAESDMTDTKIWNELSEFRRPQISLNLHPDMDWHRVLLELEDDDPTTDLQSHMVWKWKIKERGTSMNILDLSRRDFSAILQYIAFTHLNPTPRAPLSSPITYPACKIVDSAHPAHALLFPSEQPPSESAEAPTRPSSPTSSIAPIHTTPTDEPIITALTLPFYPHPARPMAAAFAVGLPWQLSYISDINPPFRRAATILPPPTSSTTTTTTTTTTTSPSSATPSDTTTTTPTNHLPTTSGSQKTWSIKRSPLRRLMWTVVFPPANPTTLVLGWPQGQCDSLLVGRLDGRAVDAHHVRALAKYAAFTSPKEWARKGGRGFEVYWETYVKVVKGEGDEGVGVGVGSPYFDEGEREEEEDGLGGGVVVGMGKRGRGFLGMLERETLEWYAARAMAHMTLEGLGEEEGRREKIAKVRELMLRVIEAYGKR